MRSILCVNACATFYPFRKNNMQRWYNVVTMWLVLLFVSSCSDRSIPRRSPVSSGSAQAFSTELTASTNCVEVGDIITFTINLQNLSDKTTTITGTPPFDITLTPVRIDQTDSAPLVRWSATDQYPIDPATILLPGERHTYSWRWQASQEFALVTRYDKNVRVALSQGELQREDGTGTPAGETRVFIGVNKYSSSGGLWKCSDMAQ